MSHLPGLERELDQYFNNDLKSIIMNYYFSDETKKKNIENCLKDYRTFL